jgi:hypothetical protein
MLIENAMSLVLRKKRGNAMFSPVSSVSQVVTKRGNGGAAGGGGGNLGEEGGYRDDLGD